MPTPRQPTIRLPITEPAPQCPFGNPAIGNEATVDIHRWRERDAVSLHEPLTLGTVPGRLLHRNGALPSESGNDVPGVVAKVAVAKRQQCDLEGHRSHLRSASAR